jgi:hypothetical protein
MVMVRYHVHGIIMSTSEKKKKAGNLAERVQGWAGEFEGESRLVIGELIAAYYNQSAIEESVVEVVRQRANVSRNIAIAHAKGLALIANMLLIESFFHVPSGMTDGTADLVEHRLGFCEAVRWLCSPKIAVSAVSSEELKTLAATGKLDWGRYPEIDQDSERFVAYFEDHGVKHFQRHLYLRDGRLLSIWTPKHMVDLFCVFLLAECAGKTPSQMPIKLCRRCPKLFFTDLEGKARERKQFCSLTCQQVGHWTKSNSARSDSGFVERLLENSRSELQTRLAKPAVRARLGKIKTDWPDWKTILEKVKEIEALCLE